MVYQPCELVLLQYGGAVNPNLTRNVPVVASVSPDAFAGNRVVDDDGQIVQIGTPAELFEKPKHTFVGYFIGSPGMNVFPVEVDGKQGPHRQYPD